MRTGDWGRCGCRACAEKAKAEMKDEETTKSNLSVRRGAGGGTREMAGR